MTFRERFKAVLSKADPMEIALKRKLRFLVSTDTFLAYVGELQDQARIADPDRSVPLQAMYNGILFMIADSVRNDEILLVKILA